MHGLEPGERFPRFMEHVVRNYDVLVLLGLAEGQLHPTSVARMLDFQEERKTKVRQERVRAEQAESDAATSLLWDAM